MYCCVYYSVACGNGPPRHRPTTNQRDKRGIGVIFCSGAASPQIYCSSSEEMKGWTSCQSISPTVNLYSTVKAKTT